MIIIEELAKYLAVVTEHPYGTSCFSYEMPDEPEECIAVIGIETHTLTAPVQIDAASQRFMLTVRSKSNTAASRLALRCCASLMPADEVGERTGFVKLLNDTTVYCYIHGEPTWQKIDQQGRKYFSFLVTLTSTRQI